MSLSSPNEQFSLHGVFINDENANTDRQQEQQQQNLEHTSASKKRWDAFFRFTAWCEYASELGDFEVKSTSKIPPITLWAGGEEKA